MIRKALVLSLLLACQPEDDDGFGGGGSNYTPKDGTSSDTGSRDDGLPSGWPAPQDTNGPSLRNLVAVHDDYPNLGDVIEANVEFWDAQDNVEQGGELRLTLNGGEWTNAATSAVIGGQAGTAWIEEDKIWFVVGNVKSFEAYDLELYVTDNQGNRSNVVSATAAP